MLTQRDPRLIALCITPQEKQTDLQTDKERERERKAREKKEEDEKMRNCWEGARRWRGWESGEREKEREREREKTG